MTPSLKGVFEVFGTNASGKMPSYQYEEAFTKLLQKFNFQETIYKLKEIKDLDGQRYLMDFVARRLPNGEKLIWGVPFPQYLGELCQKSPKFYRAYDLESEIKWTISCLRKYKKEIRLFVKCRNEYEQFFLQGKYDKCQNLLDKVRAEIGISLWYYESQFLVYEYEEERSLSIKMMSDELERAIDKSNNYILYIFKCLFDRSSSDLAPYSYDDNLHASYKRNRNELHEDYYKYLLFRLNYFNYYKDVDLSKICLFESLAALVDRYEILVTLVKSVVVTGKEYKSFKDDILELYSISHDRELWPVLRCLGENIDMPGFFNTSFVSILDEYYKGNYAKCIEKCCVFCNAETSVFDVCVIYSRCLIHLKKDFQAPLAGINVPLNQIALLVFKIINSEDVADSIYNLYKIDKNLYGFHIATDLTCFLKREENRTIDGRLKLVNSWVFDPEISLYFEDQSMSLEYLNSFHSVGGSVSCRLWESRIKQKVTTDATLSRTFRERHNAEIYLRKGQYKESLDLLAKLEKESSLCLPSKQKVISRKIECLFKQNKISKAIETYVDYYTLNVNFVAKVDTASIIEYMQSQLYCGFDRTIDLAIFVGVNCKKIVDKSFILFEFCELNDAFKPSELIKKLEGKASIKRLEAFFGVMNDNETLRHYFNISSFQDRLEERKVILEYLVHLNTFKRQIYEDELKSVVDALFVYKVSQNIDNSKIYADVVSIKKWKLPELDSMYKRYSRYFDILFKEKKSIYYIDFDDSYLLMENTNYNQEVKSEISVKSNGIYEVFKDIYDYIVDKFLYSEYGLVAYLSTRVRHGELESELRPELSGRNLVLSQINNEYVFTSYWKDTYNLTNEENRILNEALVKFSKAFDESVFYLIKELLQIKSEEKPHGLFDFVLSENKMVFWAIECGLATVRADNKQVLFCDKVFEKLWDLTNVGLDKIRKYISTDFQKAINDQIATLKYDLESMPRYCKQDIMESITKASSALSTKIRKVTEWFHVTGMKREDVDFKKLTYQVFNNILIAYPNLNSPIKNPTIKGDSFLIKSQYVIHFADLFRNVFSNMFKHGGVENHALRISIMIDIANDTLRLDAINSLPKGVDESKLNETFEEKIATQGDSYNREGGSGLPKITKIMKSDLHVTDSKFSMYAKDGNCFTNISLSIKDLKVDAEKI